MEISGYPPLFYIMSFESSSLPDFNIVVSVPEAISLEKDLTISLGDLTFLGFGRGFFCTSKLSRKKENRHQ